LTRQDATSPENMRSRQAWLQPIQVLISAARDWMTLFTNSGSARNGRASDTRSAWPLARIASAVSGILMRLDATTGTDTAFFNRWEANANAARGTAVAMVGTVDSCQPTPVVSTS